MNRLLIRNILALIVYTGFFAVQLKANFLIQENIKFRNDYNCFKQLDKSLKSNFVFQKTSKNLGKHKKGNMSRRFIPEEIKDLPVYAATPNHLFNASISKAALKNKLLSLSIFEIEDRGPPAIA